MRTRATARSTSFAVAALAALAASEARAAGGPPASSTQDAGTADTGAGDGGPGDAGTTDAEALDSAPDSATTDAAATDAAAGDAAPNDGGPNDGAAADAAPANTAAVPPTNPEAPPGKEGPLHVGKQGKPPDYYKRRFEPAGFPLIAGSSDTGIQFGVVGTLSYFSNGIKPYAWNQDVLVTLSLKGRETGGGGIEFAQQAYQWNIDVPGLFGGLVRLNPQASYTRTINEGYFGLGNASSAAEPPAGTTDKARFHEFIENTVLVRGYTRIDFARPWAILAQPMVRYVVPESYAQSKLVEDEHARAPNGGPILYGTRPLTLLSLAGGFLYDTRDNEIFTRSGMFHQVGARFDEGVPFADQVRYVELGAILTGFIPIGDTWTLAGRIVGSAQVGNPPFFDLLVAGPFQLKEAPGGSSGVRGVPIGRYLAPYKVLGNLEFRGLPIKATLFKQKLRIGGDTFVDVGRVWSTPAFHSLDGDTVGLKYGVGLGAYLLWGQAAIFRLEVAYSPDATSTGSLPVGIYVEDGTMF